MQKKSNCLSQDVVRDLAITGILDDIKQTTTDYPDVFLLFPLFDYATLCFRREIAEEVYGSHVIFEDLKRFAVDLYALQKQRSNTYRITNKEAKNHSFRAAKTCARVDVGEASAEKSAPSKSCGQVSNHS